jgi:hypothetical protein
VHPEVGVSEGDDFLLSAGQALRVRGLLIAGSAGDDVGYACVDCYMLNREGREIDRPVIRDWVFAGARCGCGGPLVSVGKLVSGMTWPQ